MLASIEAVADLSTAANQANLVKSTQIYKDKMHGILSNLENVTLRELREVGHGGQASEIRSKHLRADLLKM